MIYIRKNKVPEFFTIYKNKNPDAISLLNLNSYELRSARKSVYRMIMNMTAEDIKLAFCSEEELLSPYSNVIFWFLREVGKE